MTDTHKAIVAAEVAVEPRREPDDLDVSPVVRSIIEGNLGSDALAQLQWVHESQKEYRAEQKLAAFTRSMVAMKADPDFQPVIARDVKVAFGQTQYSYTSLPAIVAELTPHLTKYGFSISWVPEYDGDKKVGVKCRLFHVGGHIEEAFLPSSLTKKQGMSNAQEVTGTQTTLKRNTVLSLLGLASGEMEPEPRGRRDGAEFADSVDVKAALNALERVGVDRDEVEQILNKPVSEITKRDLDELRLCYRDRRAAP